MAESTPELKTYQGNCHCGAFKFNIKIPELTSVTECNCSICFKKGYKWVFPGPGCFTVEKGEGNLKDYRFGKCSILHKFCPTCGTGVMTERPGIAPGDVNIWINARALQDVDLWSLKVEKYNGAAVEPFYKPPAFNGPEPTAEIENSKLYTGSCHCGAVTLALKNDGPLSTEVELIGECDCSICSRNGRTLTYRSPSHISICLTPGTSLTSYSFAQKIYIHKFCPVCGVSVSVDDTSDPAKILMAVNLKCFEDVEWDDIKIFRADLKKLEPQYVVPE